MFPSKFIVLFGLSFCLCIGYVELMTLENVTQLKSTDYSNERMEESSTRCYLIYQPICGSDGRTYANCCFFKSAQGADPVLIPVCQAACNECNASNTFQNWSTGSPVCEADEGKDVERGCICNDIFSPVCGSNGIVYSNECRAKCAGQEKACVVDSKTCSANQFCSCTPKPKCYK